MLVAAPKPYTDSPTSSADARSPYGAHVHIHIEHHSTSTGLLRHRLAEGFCYVCSWRHTWTTVSTVFLSNIALAMHQGAHSCSVLCYTQCHTQFDHSQPAYQLLKLALSIRRYSGYICSLIRVATSTTACTETVNSMQTHAQICSALSTHLSLAMPTQYMSCLKRAFSSLLPVSFCCCTRWAAGFM